MIKKIAITGPESTGKTELAKQLAKYYNTIWVPEFSREYIDKINRPYDYDDIIEIAQEQLNREKEAEINANKFLFCDTELIVTKIWSEFKYQKCHPWILKNIEEHKYDLFLLCNIDIPWKFDKLREHRDKRKELFNLYFIELSVRKFPFEVISELGEKRMLNAIKSIEAHM